MMGNYSVTIEEFAQRHFIKSFEKKYKGRWDVTLRAVVAELERIDSLLHTSRAETIVDAGDTLLVKIEFKIAATNESAKTSGNRCIAVWHKDTRAVSVLLVYGKTDLGPRGETAEWKKMIREYYPRYKGLVGN